MGSPLDRWKDKCPMKEPFPCDLEPGHEGKHSHVMYGGTFQW